MSWLFDPKSESESSNLENVNEELPEFRITVVVVDFHDPVRIDQRLMFAGIVGLISSLHCLAFLLTACIA